MEVAPDAAPHGDDGGTTVDAGSDGGKTVDAGSDGGKTVDAGADAGGRADASPTIDAGPGGADGSAAGGDGGASDAPATVYPTSCAQAGASSGDQDVTLYAGGDPNKPWTAHCSGGNEYLPLGPSTSNYSSYPSGGCAMNVRGPDSVLTTWTMLRIDPATLVVDTSDYTGSTSTGDTKEMSGGGSVTLEYTAMPYASSRSCVDQDPSAATASVDLSGTPFGVDASQTWYLPGYSNSNSNNQPFGGASPASGKRLSLLVGGHPAGITPCQNDHYQTQGGACLQLVYSP
jgi:hypothetical protein